MRAVAYLILLLLGGCASVYDGRDGMDGYGVAQGVRLEQGRTAR